MNSTIANILICEGVIGLGILISNILFSDLILNLMFSLTSPILTGLFRNITNAKVKTFATRVLSRRKKLKFGQFLQRMHCWSSELDLALSVDELRIYGKINYLRSQNV